MKLSLNFFPKMTSGLTLGRRIVGRYGVFKVDTYHRFISGFIPHYSDLANEDSDPDFKQTVNPPYPLKRSAGMNIVRAKSATYSTVILPNESPNLGKVIYSTDLWHFFVDDPTETDLGIPDGSPATNTGIDAVLFNSKILTTHPLNGNLYYGAINATPSWTAISASLAEVVHVLKVIEDNCLVLDASQGSGKPRDTVLLIKPDFSTAAGFLLANSDYDIEDIADYQARYALLFARKTTSDASLPNLSNETTVFLWDIVPGDSYTSKFSLPGIYKCSIVKNGFVYAFTQLGSTLICSAFDGTEFKEIGRIRNVIVGADLLIPKTRIGMEGDFFVLLASSSGNDDTAPLYWNPSTGDSFFLTSTIDGQPFLSLAYALDPSANVYARYFSSQTSGGANGILYTNVLEGSAGTEFIADSYDEANQDGFFVLPGNSDDTSRAAQSFTAKGGTLDRASFYLAKEGSPTGTMVAKLYAHSGTFGSGGVPTGSPLATSDTLDISALTTDFAMVEFPFSGANQIQLAEGTHYCISFEYGAGNASNRPDVGFDSSVPTHAGNAAIFASSAWVAETSDLIFSVIERILSTASYKSNPIPIPSNKETTDIIARAQIERIELLFNEPPPTSDDSIMVTLITKDEYDSETYASQTAIVKDTAAHSTSANLDGKRAIIQLGAYATEFEIDIAVTLASADWNLVIRDIVIVYEPTALQF